VTDEVHAEGWMIFCGGAFILFFVPLSSLQTIKSYKFCSRISRAASINLVKKTTLNLEQFDNRPLEHERSVFLIKWHLENLYYFYRIYDVTTICPRWYCYKSARFCSVRSCLSRTEHKKEMLKISAVKYLPGKRLPL